MDLTGFPWKSMNLNRILGMMVGHNIGDALGAPHEFKRNLKYTGSLIHEISIPSRFQGIRKYPVASVTDDTSMSMALMNSILKHRAYCRDDVCMSYIKWSHDWKIGIGKNTRFLFHNPYKRDGFKNYLEAWDVAFGRNNVWTQSNGSLMRLYPLAILCDDNGNPPFDIFISDCYLSNPHVINQDSSIVYGYALWLAIRGYDRKYIWKK